jgi:hypothetical protein
MYPLTIGGIFPDIDLEMIMAFPQAPQPLVVDCSVNCQAAAPQLAARGVKVVMRYYSRINDPAAPPGKRLTKSEAKAIHAAGMAIGLTYEHGKKLDEFTAVEAQKAADYCLSRDAGLNPSNPEAISHPKGTVIYFAVDTDQLNDHISDIKTFFQTIKDRFAANNAPFVLGVYGSGFSCNQLRASPLQVRHFWLAGASWGWRDTRDFYNQPGADWNLFQNALEVPLEVSVDTNLVNPSAGGLLGAFDRNGLIAGLNDSAIRANLRFTKPGEPATFYVAPGGERLFHDVPVYDSQGHQTGTKSVDFIGQRRMVSVLAPGADWTKVEVSFDVGGGHGVVQQGYVRTERLVAIDQMP